MRVFRYYFFLILHVVVLLLWYTSPFYLPWYVVVLTVLAYYLQNIFLHKCILTMGQFGNADDGFYYHYLIKAGFHPDEKKLNYFLDYVIPPVLIGFAFIYQLVI